MSAKTVAREALNVLIVEDNRDARTTMRMLLSIAHGHAVSEAADGEAGVQSAREMMPDVALVDLGLPDTDGCDVARRIRALPGGAHVALIALTGYASQEDQRRAEHAGFDRFLVKPADPAALLAILDDIARAKSAAAGA